MTEQTIIALYIGHADDPTQARFAARGWHLIQPQSVYEALAQYIFYVPHVIIFDARTPDAELIFQHISTVTSTSPRHTDVMLVINNREAWLQTPQTILMQHLHTDALEAAIVAAMRQRELMLFGLEMVT